MSLYNISGVDYATQQPNYAFAGVLPLTTIWFDQVNDWMLTYGTAGVELELTATRNNGLTILENCLHYFRAAQKYGWNDCFMTTYYYSSYIDAYCRSLNPEMRLIYDKLYRYISSSLRGEWRFSEANGFDVKDSSENLNNGDMQNSILTSPGGINRALTLVGSNDYVIIPDNDSLDITDAITVEAWIKPDNISTWQSIISRDEYGRRLLLRPGGNIQADFGTIINTTNSPVIAGQWNHINNRYSWGSPFLTFAITVYSVNLKKKHFF